MGDFDLQGALKKMEGKLAEYGIRVGDLMKVSREDGCHDMVNYKVTIMGEDEKLKAFAEKNKDLKMVLGALNKKGKHFEKVYWWGKDDGKCEKCEKCDESKEVMAMKMKLMASQKRIAELEK